MNENTQNEAAVNDSPGKPSDGLLVIYTGDGKGKTTAALGMALRAAGYGWKIAIVQFIKGSWKYGELESLKRLEPEVELHVAGAGFVGIIDDKLPLAEHRRVAQEAFALAVRLVTEDQHRLLILDELNVAIDLKLIELEQVVNMLEAKPRKLNLVITGRGAASELIERADLVTEMKEIKHPYQKGILAKKGIDF